jgi:hypothetical protein
MKSSGASKRTLILYGNGVQFMNTATFYCHGKFFHNEIIKTIKINYKQLQLEMVDESYTTKTCSNCQRMNGLKISTGIAIKMLPKIYC